MKDSFWVNKPLEISDKEIKTIVSGKDLINKVNKEIDINKFQLGYSIVNTRDLSNDKFENILEFINKNYVTSDDDSFKLVYTRELLQFYINDDTLILEFYPKKSKTIIGYIFGKVSSISLDNQILNTSEVNFLCIIPKLRSLGISSYMINVLTREIIMKHNIIMAHYTISNKIKSPHFGEKIFYHRFINIKQLLKTKFVENVDEQLLIQAYNNFNISKSFYSKHTIKYIHNEIVDNHLMETLYNKYMEYCKTTYRIYEHVTIEEFKKTFSNDAFYNFVVYKKDKIVGYVCLFRLDSRNVQVGEVQRAGFYHYMFLDDISSELEFIHEYIYSNDIFDVITFSDIFEIDYNKIRCIRGSGFLRYYFYNLKCPSIKNSENGLITI
jgi:hypothetical protein